MPCLLSITTLITGMEYREKGERWKCNKKRHQNYLLASLYNHEGDSNSHEHLYFTICPCSFVSNLIQSTSLVKFYQGLYNLFIKLINSSFLSFKIMVGEKKSK